MAGIDTITKEILQDAQTQADQILADANASAAKIRQEAQGKADELMEKADEKAEEEKKELKSRTDSAAQMNARSARLAVKQQIIDQILQKAYDRLASQDDTSYFEMIQKLLEGSVQSGDGQMCFGEKDLKRLPAGFEKEVSRIAAGKGGTLTISPEAEKISNGFILKYGGIEENCTLDAIFAQKRDVLRDKVHEILW